MFETLIQILLVATVAIAVKAFAVFAAKRGFSPLPIVVLLGVVLGPTVLNLFDQPLFTSGVGLSEDTSGASFMRVLIELGLIQLVFATGARTDFVNLKKRAASVVLSGLAIFLIPAAFSIIVLKIFGASWGLALATASVVSVVSAAFTVRTKQSDGERAAIAQGAALTTFILGAGLLFVAVGLRFEPTYGSGMTALGIVYAFLQAFLLIGTAFVVGRLYIRRLAWGGPTASGIQGVIGFVLLLAFFYGWAAWSVGQIAALPVAFVFGGLFASSKFVVKDRAISILSKPDAWLICLFFLAFGFSADFYEIKSQADVFMSLSAAAIAGRVCGAVLGAKITEQTAGEGLKLAARTFSIGEAGLILAIFAHGRGAITPGIFAVVVAVMALTTFAGPFLSGFRQTKAKYPRNVNSSKRSRNRKRPVIFGKAV